MNKPGPTSESTLQSASTNRRTPYRLKRLTRLQVIFTLVLAVPFILQAALAIGLTSWLLTRSRQQAVEDITSRFVSEISNQVYDRLEIFLETPHIVNQINADSARLGQLDVNDIRKTELRFWRQIQVYDSLSSIGFGRKDGAYIAGDRRGQVFRVGHRDSKSPEGKLHMYRADDAGNPTELAYTGNPNYDPRVRPWYDIGKAAEQGQWTDIFTYSSQPIYVVSAVQAFYDQAGVFQGVALTDLILSDINAFLQTLDVGESGEVFIMERSGALVAASTAEQPFDVIDGEAKRLQASESRSSITQNAAQSLWQAFGDLRAIESAQQESFMLDSDRYFLQVRPYADKRGLDWLIVVVLPESDLAIDTSYLHSAIALGLLAFALLLLISWLVLRSFIRPIANLAATATDVASGNGEKPGTITRLNDIGAITTTFNKLSKQLQSSLLQLEDQKAKLEERNQDLDQFTYAVSHDLKAPLRAIDNLSMWLEEDLGDRLPGDNKAQLQLLRQRVARMNALINGLLEFSRVGRSSVAVEVVDLNQMLAEVVDSLAPPESFTIQVQSNLPTIETRRLLLQRVFANLIGNAIKHSDRRDGTVKISLQERDHLYTFAVSDDGPGIRPEYHERIFGIFETLKSRDSAENTGIGLSLVKKIVEMEGGKIWVESELGEGAVFRFTWPKLT
ncbi:MAG: ATP-binding protein [Elainellaceae cyanobacterium]